MPSPEIHRCNARRTGDQMHCWRCGLQWDISDPEKPLCKNSKKYGLQVLADIKRRLRDTQTSRRL